MANPYQMTPQELLARTLMAEAGQESLVGQQGVGQVIMNRVNSPNYPNSVNDVIMQPGQFSAFNDITGYAGGSGANTAWQGAIPPQINDVAAQILAGGQPDPTGGALNYYNPTIANPKWGGPGFAGLPGDEGGGHIFGTAGAADTAGFQANPTASALAGAGGQSTAVGGAGSDVPQDTSLRGRITGFLGKHLGDSSNPTIAAATNRRRAEVLRGNAERARDVFNTNAPTSWVNVLGSVANDLAATVQESRADRRTAAGQEQIAQLLGSGQNLTPEQIAKVTALNPELGNQLRMEARRSAEEERIYGRNRADAVADRELARTQAVEDREDQQAHELARDAAKPKTGVTPTAAMKNAQALGYEPGTQKYRDYVEEQTNPNNSPEVLAARALAKGDETWHKESGKGAANRLNSMFDTANSSADKLPKLDRMSTALANANTGTFAGPATTVGEFLSWAGVSTDNIDEMYPGLSDILRRFGATPDQAASMEVMNAIAAEMTTGMIGTDGFPANNFSDADRKFLQQIFPQATDTAIGAFEKIGQLQYRYIKSAQKRDEWLDYKAEHGDTRESFERFESEFNKEMARTAQDEMQAIIYGQIEQADAEQDIVHVTVPEDLANVPPGSKVRNPEDHKVYVWDGTNLRPIK